MAAGPVTAGSGRPLATAPFTLPAVRVHPTPTRPPTLRRDTTGERIGPNRFDDPENVYAVRYLADGLHGCLVECLARFRQEADADAQRRAAIIGVDEELEPDDGDLLCAAIGDWLAQQRVAAARPAEPSGAFVDVADPKTQDVLSADPRVREQLAAMHTAGYIADPFLDGAALRVGGTKGRALTQAVSRAVYDAQPRPDGVRYRSRLDDTVGCWAVFGQVDLDFISVEALDPTNPAHRRAVRDVLTMWRLPLPEPWRD